MWGMELVVKLYFPLVLPVLGGIFFLARHARRCAPSSSPTGRLRASRALLASAIALWAGCVAISALTVAMIADAFLSIRLVDRPFGIPITIPVISSFYPHDPHPVTLVPAVAVALAGLAIGAFALREGQVPAENAVGPYVQRVLKPTGAITLGTLLFTVVWGLVAGLD